MAELLVQRKKTSVLPWILLTILVLAIVGWLVWRNQHTASNTITNTTTTQALPDSNATRTP